MNFQNCQRSNYQLVLFCTHLQKARIQRRRLLDNRLTDAHGNRIELDRNRDDARGDNSPRDTHGGLDGETHDKPLFEDYSGQGLHSAFPSDIPPPVLMPVPGAG